MTSPTHDLALSGAQLSMLSAMLDEQRQFRVEQLVQHGAVSVPSTRARTEADQEISDTILRGARVALVEIEAARTRMADCTYGRCVDCAAPLTIERLEILPYAARCASCQSAKAR
jgi:DnaK suppressor protein